MVAKTGLVVLSSDGVSRKTVGRLIGRALKSCHQGLYETELMRIFFVFMWTFSPIETIKAIHLQTEKYELNSRRILRKK